MKQLSFLLILAFINCTHPVYDTNGYIEFVHIGTVNHPYNPLYISTKEVDIQLNREQLADLQQMIGKNVKITQAKVKDYIKLKFDMVVTDKKTYRFLSEFIYSNRNFYTNGEQINDSGAESYDVHVNNSKFSIYSKLKNKYFEDLKAFLVERKCDEKVIKALSYL